MQDPKQEVISLFGITRFYIAKILWGQTILERDYLYSEFDLARRRQKLEEKIYLLKLPPRLQQTVQQGIFLVEQAYNDTFIWFFIYQRNQILALSNIKFITNDSSYCCAKFITPTGEFNDVKWVKQFVNDSNQDILDRFRFACFYCFETKINVLWSQCSNIYPGFHNKDYKSIRRSKRGLVSFWIHYLDGKLAEWAGELRNRSTYFYYALRDAIKSGHRSAVYYFWGKLSLSERMALLNNIHKYAELVHSAAKSQRYKILYFLYSSLATEQQQYVLKYDLKQQDWPAIWDCYLQPAFVSLIPDQIKKHHATLSAYACSYVLVRLVQKFIDEKNPLYKEIFQTVWQLSLPEKKGNSFNEHLLTINELIAEKEFTCAKLVIQDCSFLNKRKILFSGAKEIINKFFNENDLSAIQNYLLLFIIDLNEETVPSLKPYNSKSLMLLKELRENILTCPFFKVPKQDRIVVIKQIENLMQDIEINFLMKELIFATEKKGQ